MHTCFRQTNLVIEACYSEYVITGKSDSGKTLNLFKTGFNQADQSGGFNQADQSAGFEFHRNPVPHEPFF